VRVVSGRVFVHPFPSSFTTTVLVSPSINRSSDFVLDPKRLAAIGRRRTGPPQPERSATGGTHLGRAAADEGRRG
jgi:hypothetical protein